MTAVARMSLTVAALAVILWFLTPARLNHVAQLPANTAVLSLAQEQSSGLIANTEKRIVWAAGERKTGWSVVSLHGFSASRQETAPLAEQVAGRLGANLFETRLTGHGLIEQALVDVTAEQWLDDTAEALAVGASLGDKVIVIGTSTGATLPIAMLKHALMAQVDTLVFLSPNFGPRDTNSAWLTRPAGPLLVRLLVGGTRSWTAHNDLQARYWITSYPMDAAVQMMRLVDRANSQLPARIPQRVLFFYSPDDTVISTGAMTRAFDQIDSPQKEMVLVRDPGDPSHHILAGDILSAAKTEEIAAGIVAFILPPTP